MRALVFERKVAKFAAARVAGMVAGPGRGSRVGPLRLADIDEPELPGPGWVRVRPRLAGICGSDLATIDATSSRYFEPIVSFPFVPGHEIVGELDDSTRVVVMSTLTCAARGIDPPCTQCAHGATNLCERTAFGHISPGLQTGFCEDTGGGWSVAMVAHQSQLFPVPDDFTDEQAVMIEPVACAIHGAFHSLAVAERSIAVIGSGTLGLGVIAALRQHDDESWIVATAKYPDQKRWAKELGASVVAAPDELDRAVRRHTGSLVAGDQVTGGIGCVIDCVGSADSIAQALRVVRPGGHVVLVGMPGVTTLDLTPLWFREVSVTGSYAYTRHDFEQAVELIRARDLGRLVTATYSIDRYNDAIQHAAEAGRRGAVKIAFDLRNERNR
ncbi:MAG TPA: zinc-binding dehydrogenase [Acidimicrobiales bacterium]|nr:zinc-binding dehydrogenase [Acidimicrobiales bacterium]